MAWGVGRRSLLPRRRGKVFLGTPPLSRGAPREGAVPETLRSTCCVDDVAARGTRRTGFEFGRGLPVLLDLFLLRGVLILARARRRATPLCHLAHLARAAASKIGLRNRGAGSPSTPASTGDAAAVGPRAARPSGST